MGKVFYDMGFLSTAEVVECSATDLIGQYVGHTGPKTQKLLEKALGKVLFIDEAYRLAEGGFATEALGELVDSLTKPKYCQKMITILAGYDNDINRLLSINEGLTSRFPEAIVFKGLTPEQCATLMTNILMKKGNLDSKSVEQATNQSRGKLLEAFKTLAALPSWGNARDLQTLVKSIYGSLLVSFTVTADSPILVLGAEDIFSAIQSMISERVHREDALNSRRPLPDGLEEYLQTIQMQPPTQDIPGMSFETTQDVEQTQQSNEDDAASPSITLDSGRDTGVSDAIWQQLHKDKFFAEQLKKEHEKITHMEREIKEKAEREEAQAKLELELLRDQTRQKAEDDEKKRLYEDARLRHEMARRKRAMDQADLIAKVEKAKEERQKEAMAQKKLRNMGVCSAGFHWIKQQGGYRCAGGFHFVSNANIA